jgi:hypothetical protein
MAEIDYEAGALTTLSCRSVADYFGDDNDMAATVKLHDYQLLKKTLYRGVR